MANRQPLCEESGWRSKGMQMSDGGDRLKDDGLNEILNDANRYSEAVRRRERKEQWQGGIWFSLFLLLIGLAFGLGGGVSR